MKNRTSEIVKFSSIMVEGTRITSALDLIKSLLN